VDRRDEARIEVDGAQDRQTVEDRGESPASRLAWRLTYPRQHAGRCAVMPVQQRIEPVAPHDGRFRK
jgi:hypothetical protein